MFGGAFMRPEWGKDRSGQSPSERLFKLRLKATSAFTTLYYPRAFSGRFEAELRCTDTSQDGCCYTLTPSDLLRHHKRRAIIPPQEPVGFGILHELFPGRIKPQFRADPQRG